MNRREKERSDDLYIHKKDLSRSTATKVAAVFRMGNWSGAALLAGENLTCRRARTGATLCVLLVVVGSGNGAGVVDDDGDDRGVSCVGNCCHRTASYKKRRTSSSRRRCWLQAMN